MLKVELSRVDIPKPYGSVRLIWNHECVCKISKYLTGDRANIFMVKGD